MSELLLLKKEDCKSCYKCIRECALKSIRFSENRAQIVERECVYCGHCYVTCPQSAKEIRRDTDKAKALIASGRPVIVSLAPSFIADFGVGGLDGMRQALLKLGFADVEETARGARIVKTEYERMIASGEHKLIISSCCHSVNLLIQKRYPQALPYLAKVDSPMLAHAKSIKERVPGSAVVFIGPCISKKDEAEQYGQVDCVLTFDELIDWLAEEGIELPAGEQPDGTEARSRFFPTAGGIIRSMDLDDGFSYIPIDGLHRCMDALEEIERGGMQNCFVEMNACEGSCIGGPVMHRYHSAPITCKTRVEQYSGKSGRDFDDQPADDLRKSMQYIGSGAVKPGESAIQEVLHKLGKYRPEDELNCGTCGYSTCREKAIAVCQGKADLTMCLPFLKARAESFSGAILDNTPNAIMAMDTKLIIQQANESAARLFGMESPREMVGMPIDAILGTVEYLQAIDGERPDGSIRHYLPEYDKYVEETIAFDPEYNLVISIIKDITDETRREQELDKERRRTAELADRVIEKQMRVAQEIASLLGETTAETKIALTRLKDTIEPGGEVKR